jgi:hypothetical protein
LGMGCIHRLNRIGRCEGTSERESEGVTWSFMKEEKPPFEVGRGREGPAWEELGRGDGVGEAKRTGRRDGDKHGRRRDASEE